MSSSEKSPDLEDSEESHHSQEYERRIERALLTMTITNSQLENGNPEDRRTIMKNTFGDMKSQEVIARIEEPRHGLLEEIGGVEGSGFVEDFKKLLSVLAAHNATDMEGPVQRVLQSGIVTLCALWEGYWGKLVDSVKYWGLDRAGRVRNAAHAFRLSTPFMESFRSKTETLLATKPLTPDILAEVVADWSVKFKDFLVKDPPKFPLPKEFDKYLEKLFPRGLSERRIQNQHGTSRFSRMLAVAAPIRGLLSDTRICVKFGSKVTGRFLRLLYGARCVFSHGSSDYTLTKALRRRKDGGPFFRPNEFQIQLKSGYAFFEFEELDSEDQVQKDLFCDFLNSFNTFYDQLIGDESGEDRQRRAPVKIEASTLVYFVRILRAISKKVETSAMDFICVRWSLGEDSDEEAL